MRNKFGVSVLVGALATAATLAPVATAQDIKSYLLKLEQSLAVLGFDPGPIDGAVSSQTNDAIMAYQRARGLPVTGGATFADIDRIAAEAAGRVAVAPAPAPAPQPLPPAAAPQAGPVIYHQMSDCPYEFGMAVAVYFNAVDTILELTDVCSDRAGGRLFSSEPDQNLVLVREVEGGKFFEVVVPGKATYQRTRLHTGGYEPFGMPAGLRAGAVDFDYQKAEPQTLRHGGGQSLNINGFLTETHFSPTQIAGPFKLWISGLDYNKDELRKYGTDRFGSEVPYFGFSGQLTFSGGTASGTVNDTGDGDGKGTGTLTLTMDADGRLSGSGSFSLTNARLAGMNPADWKTTRWDIEKLIGLTAGSDGQEFRAIAIARGETIDHDGAVNPVHAVISIAGLGPKYKM